MMAAVDGMALPYTARDREDLFSGHRNTIEEIVQEGYIDNEIIAALTKQLITSERSLQRRL
jgi:hypothetical protein